MFRAINPATEELIREFASDSQADVDRKLAAAQRSFLQWREAPPAERSTAMVAAADVLRAEQRQLAERITEEMGKPIRQALAEVEKCAWGCEFFARHAQQYLAPRSIQTDASGSLVRYDPLGVLLAIMPWNFPLWQAFRFAAPALMAGNVALLKHAANVPGCALAIEEVFREAGFPVGVFTTLLVSSDTANQLIGHPIIQAVSLTGSEQAGIAVATAASQHVKKCVLELGGSDPFIVLADAGVNEAAQQAAVARCQNSGQSCIAAKRFIVEEPIADKFAQRFAEKLAQLKLGDPRDPAIDMGPLARADLRESLHNQVARTIEAGARLLIGGLIPQGKGFFYPPTLLDHVTPGMAAFDEETFGPVAAVVRARNVDHAIELANESRYGLGASIWSGHPQRAAGLAPRIEAGCVFINEIVKSDPRLPFGGVKRSGYGRELSEFGIREFVNIKTVWVG